MNWERTGEGSFFLLTTTSIPTLGPTQLPIQWVPGVLSLGVKQPGHEGQGQEYVELYLHSSNMPSWGGAKLKKSTGTTLPLPGEGSDCDIF